MIPPDWAMAMTAALFVNIAGPWYLGWAINRYLGRHESRQTSQDEQKGKPMATWS